MDDILQRMLAIDRQAEEIIKEAEEKAEKINTEGRLQINTLNTQAQQSLQQEAGRMETEKISVVEKECAEKTAAAEKDFEARGQEFIAGIASHKDKMIRMLAFPA